MKRRLLAVLLTLTMVLSLMTPVLAAGEIDTANGSESVVEVAPEESADKETTGEETTGEETTGEETTGEETTGEETTGEEPADEEPADEEPTDEEPADEEPADEEPTDEIPDPDVPTTDLPEVEEPKTPEFDVEAAYEKYMSSSVAAVDELQDTLTEEQWAELMAYIEQKKAEQAQISEEALALYQQFMATTSTEEVDALLGGMTDEELAAFAEEIGEERMAALEKHFTKLLNEEEVEEEEPVVEDNRVATYPTVGFTDAVPMFEEVAAESAEDEETVAEEPGFFASLFSLRSTRAQEVTTDKNAGDTSPNNGLELRKWVQTNIDGSYTVNLEAWTTGVVVTTQTTKPMDIVLVIDQSGSMKRDFSNITEGDRYYHPTTAKQVFDNFSNVWVRLEDGSLAPVKVTRETVYVEPPTPVAGQPNSFLYSNRNNLFYKDENGNYIPVTVTRDWVWTAFLQGHYQYTYSWDGGSTTSDDENESPNISGNLYIRNTDNKYTFTYVDGSGNVIGGPVTVIGDNSAPPDWNYVETFSESSTQPRLDALVNAVNGFVKNVAEKADPDGIPNSGDEVDHRIAVVGFSSSGTDNGVAYNNTELLTGVEIKVEDASSIKRQNGTYYYPASDGNARNGSQYYEWVASGRGGSYVGDKIPDTDYAKALQSVKDADGKANVEAAIDALTAHGGTQTQDGFKMANKIFENNEIDDLNERSRVVILFTDGQPDSKSVGTTAIDEAEISKTTYGAKVYSIGIFDGADASKAGSRTAASDTASYGNWFMQQVSSNNGTPQTPSYYLSASNSDELNTIFQNISNTASSSSQNLGSETVVRDIVSPYFTVPDEAAVTLQLADYNGASFGDAYTAPPSVSGNVKDGVLDVTGFDFNANFIADKGRVEGNPNAQGDFYGRKLIIQFTIKPKEGFLGGNNVPTNGENSGIYSSKTATEATEKFAVPKVDVPIDAITVTAADKNVYLLGSVAESDLTSGASIQCGTVDISDWDALEEWQKAYVTFSASANPTSATDIKTDTDYTLTATLTPTDVTGSLTAVSGSGSAKVNVFKPVVTFKDDTVYYGAPKPTVAELAANKVSETWKNGSTEDSSVTMIGSKPSITYEYTIADTYLTNGCIDNNRKDVPVDVTAKIGDTPIDAYITYAHQDCSDETWGTRDYEFLLHVKTCTLEITKSGWAAIDENQSFIFKVMKTSGGVPVDDLQVTVQGNGTVKITGLPVGTYTVTEDSGWSWRYALDSKTSTDKCTVDKDNATGSVTMVNTRVGEKWLSGCSIAVNKFPEKKEETTD